MSARRRTAGFDRSVAEFFMGLAIAEAKKGVGHTHPNPAVGAVLVRNGRVVGRGFHAKAGTAHAEVVALKAAGARAKGADLYTTLEPCNHHGRTPPCSDAILAAGVRRVFFASSDPNPKVNGTGLAKLRKAGVEVQGPVLEAEADALNRPFFKAMRTGLPWVTLKLAATLDGQAATHGGDSKWISSEASRREVHALRAQVDAVLVGVGTALADDPQLTARTPKGRDPLRVVLDGQARLSPTSKLVRQRSTAKTVVATRASGAKVKALEAAGAEVWRFAGSSMLAPVLKQLVARGALHVLAEGGPTVAGALLDAGLVDEVWLYLGPKLAGEQGRAWSGVAPVARMAQATALEVVDVSRPGGDIKVVLRPKR